MRVEVEDEQAPSWVDVADRREAPLLRHFEEADCAWCSGKGTLPLVDVRKRFGRRRAPHVVRGFEATAAPIAEAIVAEWTAADVLGPADLRAPSVRAVELAVKAELDALPAEERNAYLLVEAERCRPDRDVLAYLKKLYGHELESLVRQWAAVDRKLVEVRERAEREIASRSGVTAVDALHGFEAERRYGPGGTGNPMYADWGADKYPQPHAHRPTALSDQDKRTAKLRQDAASWCRVRGVRLEEIAAKTTGRLRADDPRRLKQVLAAHLLDVCGATQTETAEIVGLSRQRVNAARAAA